MMETTLAVPALPLADPTEIARSARLILRTWLDSDAAQIARVWGDAVTMRFAGGPMVPDPGEQIVDRARRSLLGGMRVYAQHGVSLWALVERADGAVVGACGFHRVDDSTLELAYHLRRDRWGRGLATEAARAALSYADRALQPRRCVAWTDPAHPASQGVLLKCGFSRVGPDPGQGGEILFTRRGG